MSMYANPCVSRSPLAVIASIAELIGQKAPSVHAEANEIVTMLGEMRNPLPDRCALIDAIEDVCGDDVSASCTGRIADAVLALCRAELRRRPQPVDCY